MAQAQTQALENQGNSGVHQHDESRLDISKLDAQSAHALQMLMMQSFFDKFVRQSDLEKFATKSDLDKFATKEDLKNFATKADLSDLRTEVFKEFGKVDKQFGEVNKQLGEMRGEITALRAEMKLLIYKLAGSIIGSVFLSAGGIIAFSH